MPQTDKKSFRIHEGRGHLSRRQLTSRAFNARVHSSLYIKHGAGFGAFGRAATRPGPRDQARATQRPPGTHLGLSRGTQEPPKTIEAGPRAARRLPGAAKRAPREPQEVSGGLPDHQKTMTDVRPPEAQKVSPEAPKRLPRSPQREHAGTKTQQGKRQEETKEDEGKRSQDKRRPKRQKPAQDKTRQNQGTDDKRRPEGRSVCSETSLFHYTVPQTYQRSVGSTKAAAT